jgi:hypothetical protein
VPVTETVGARSPPRIRCFHMQESRPQARRSEPEAWEPSCGLRRITQPGAYRRARRITAYRSPRSARHWPTTLATALLTISASRGAVITSSGRRWLRSWPPGTVRRTVGRAGFLYITAYVENSLFCRISRANSGMMWPCRGGTASMRNLSQRPTEASSRPVTPDQREAGLEVSSIDGVTLSDGEGRENAHTPAAMGASGYPVLGQLWRPERLICRLGVSQRSRGPAAPAAVPGSP